MHLDQYIEGLSKNDVNKGFTYLQLIYILSNLPKYYSKGISIYIIILLVNKYLKNKKR